jgi:exodeoxyribonuclease VII large subunit
VKQLAGAVGLLAGSRLRQQRRDWRFLVEHLTTGFRRTVAQQYTDLEQLGAIVEAYDPRRVLVLGYSITRDETGKAITDAASVKPGGRIITYLAKGQLHSTVTKTAATNSEDIP